MKTKRYQFQFSRAAEKHFSALEHKIQGRILKKLHYFEQSGKPLTFAKPLKGVEGIVRFRVGDYRIITRINDEGKVVILVVLKIAHRREAY